MENTSMEGADFTLPAGHRRRRSSKTALQASILVSIVISLILHGLMLVFLGKANIIPWQYMNQDDDDYREEPDWFVVSRASVEHSGDRKPGEESKRVKTQKTEVSDANLVSEPMKVQDVEVAQSETLAPIVEVPELKITEADLDDAYKTLALAGVDTGHTGEANAPEILAATLPKLDVPLNTADVLFDIPDVPDATLVPSSDTKLDLKGVFMVAKPELAPVMLPADSIGTGWSVSYVKQKEHGGVASGMSVWALSDAREGVLVRGGLNWKTGQMTGGGGMARRASATLGVKVRLGGGISFAIPDGAAEEEVVLADPMIASESVVLEEVRLKEGGEAIELSESLDGFVNVEVKVMHEDDGSGYYQALISPNEKCAELNDVPKDVLFIIDHSGSIQPGRLAQFKNQTSAALSYLNPEDRFNIISFASSANTFFPQFVAPTRENIANARRYIDGLYCMGTTDVFGGIGPFVKRSNGEPKRPVIVFVMTDGKSTIALHKGEVTVDNMKSNAVLKAIVDSNPGNVSIYPFSAGRNTNRMLMDFMARLNRGMPMHSPSGEDFNNELSFFLRSHLSLIVRKFRYIAEGRISDSIYPRTLPHLYRNESLAIYGRFEPTDEEVVMTLLGYDAQGNLRNLVFRRKFSECEEVERDVMDIGMVSLKEQWIAQKTLHLLAEWVSSYEPNKSKTPEMRRKRMELNALLGTITAFSKYSELLQ